MEAPALPAYRPYRGIPPNAAMIMYLFPRIRDDCVCVRVGWERHDVFLPLNDALRTAHFSLYSSTHVSASVVLASIAAAC